MNYFMVCINPECDQLFHPVSVGVLNVVANMGIPVIASINGEQPPIEAAISPLELFLESNPEDKLKDMAYEKLKSLQAQLTEECTCPTCTEPKETESSESSQMVGKVSGVVSVEDPDDYYRSAEYKAHRVRMEALEIERTKAEILNQQAQTQLVEAKARLTNAEAQKLELDLPTLKRVKPTTSDKESAELSNTVQNLGLRLAAVESKLAL